MHSKAKGMVGHLAVARDLVSKGYSVFTELGDLSRIDLIAVKDHKMVKIQVKSRHFIKDDGVGVRPKKNGPNYSYRYSEDDVDVFAIYVLDYDKEMILYVNSREPIAKNGIYFQFGEEAKCVRRKDIAYCRDYLDFEKAVKGAQNG